MKEGGKDKGWMQGRMQGREAYSLRSFTRISFAKCPIIKVIGLSLQRELEQKAVDKSERNVVEVQRRHTTKFHFKPSVTMAFTTASKPGSGAVRSSYPDTEDQFS